MIDDYAEVTIEHNGVKIQFNLNDMAEIMSEDDRKRMAEALCWDELMEEALKRLAGESFCHSSSDYEKSFFFLRDQIIDEALKLRFGAFDKVRQLIQDQLFEARLYWKLWHNSEWFRERGVDILGWMRDNGFDDSNYCDSTSGELANKIMNNISLMMKQELEKLQQAERKEAA